MPVRQKIPIRSAPRERPNDADAVRKARLGKRWHRRSGHQNRSLQHSFIFILRCESIAATLAESNAIGNYINCHLRPRLDRPGRCRAINVRHCWHRAKVRSLEWVEVRSVSSGRFQMVSEPRAHTIRNYRATWHTESTAPVYRQISAVSPAAPSTASAIVAASNSVTHLLSPRSQEK